MNNATIFWSSIWIFFKMYSHIDAVLFSYTWFSSSSSFKCPISCFNSIAVIEWVPKVSKRFISNAENKRKGLNTWLMLLKMQ